MYILTVIDHDSEKVYSYTGSSTTTCLDKWASHARLAPKEVFEQVKSWGARAVVRGQYDTYRDSTGYIALTYSLTHTETVKH